MDMNNLKKEGREVSKAVGNLFKTVKQEISSKSSETSEKPTATETLKAEVTSVASTIKTSIATATAENELQKYDFSGIDMSSLKFYRDSGNIGTIIYEPGTICNSHIAIIRGKKNIAIPNLFLSYGILGLSSISALEDCFEIEPSIDTILNKGGNQTFVIDSIYPAKFKNVYGDYMELQKKGKLILSYITDRNE